MMQLWGIPRKDHTITRSLRTALAALVLVSLVSGGAIASVVASPTQTLTSPVAPLSDDAEPAIPTRHTQHGTGNGTVTLDNVTAKGICTDYEANTATFEIINTDDDTATVSYVSQDGKNSGQVTIAPGESVRVDDVDTTSIATGLESVAITLFVENAPGNGEQYINYGNDPTPCGDAVATYPNVVFNNQTTAAAESFAVTIDEAALPSGGFVVFTNESEAVVATSYYIGEGVAKQVDVDLYPAFENATAGDRVTLTATLYRDTNDNGKFDPTVDQPYKSQNGTTSATATVTYDGNTH